MCDRGEEQPAPDLQLVATAEVAPAGFAVDPGSVRLGRDWLLGFDSANTRASYSVDLNQFAAWLADQRPGQPVDLLTVDRPMIDRYARYLGEVRHLKPATVARKLASLASCYGYAVSGGLLLVSPAAHVRRPQVSTEGTTRALTLDELIQLRTAAADAGPRDAALIEVLALTAVRISEAIGIRIEQMRPEGSHWVVPVRRKGGKINLVPLPDATCAAVDAITDGRTTGQLFLDRAGRPLDRWDAIRILRRLARAARIVSPDTVTPHCLRTTYATLAFQLGVAPHRIQEGLGHKNFSTTDRYRRDRGRLDEHANYAIAGAVSQKSTDARRVVEAIAIATGYPQAAVG